MLGDTGALRASIAELSLSAGGGTGSEWRQQALKVVKRALGAGGCMAPCDSLPTWGNRP